VSESEKVAENFKTNRDLPEFNDNKEYPPIKETKDHFLSWF